MTTQQEEAVRTAKEAAAGFRRALVELRRLGLVTETTICSDRKTDCTEGVNPLAARLNVTTVDVRVYCEVGR